MNRRTGFIPVKEYLPLSAPSLGGGHEVKLYDGCRIRKMTPKECFRLMGFEDKDVDILIENGISKTQVYKMAGNSIVVNVLEAIFEKLYGGK